MSLRKMKLDMKETWMLCPHRCDITVHSATSLGFIKQLVSESRSLRDLNDAVWVCSFLVLIGRIFKSEELHPLRIQNMFPFKL